MKRFRWRWRAAVLAGGLLVLGQAPAGPARPPSPAPRRVLPRLDWGVAPEPPNTRSQAVEPQPPPMRVMTDTPEYCAHLAALYGLLRQSGGVPEAGDDALAQQGAVMCGQGKVRMGVRALRRALVGFGPPP